MPTLTINTDALNSPQAAAHFAVDRRYMSGLRAACTLLGIPEPDYARKSKPGSTPALAAKAAFEADNPTPFIPMLAPRKPNASPEAVAAARARNQLNRP